jgi:hypothetical protein
MIAGKSRQSPLLEVYMEIDPGNGRVILDVDGDPQLGIN